MAGAGGWGDRSRGEVAGPQTVAEQTVRGTDGRRQMGLALFSFFQPRFP